MLFNIFKRNIPDNSKKRLSTSKLLILFLFINCSVIEIFTMCVTLQSMYVAQSVGYNPDFTPLVTLIGAVVGEVIGFAVYAVKAKAENTSGGIEYETVMYKLQQQPIDDGPVFKEEDITGGQPGHEG